MAKPILRSERAESDLVEIAAWLAEHSRPAAAKLFQQFESLCDVLGEQPGIGSPRFAHLFPHLSEPLRFVPLRGFDRLMVFYRDHADAVEILRVWDCSRELATLFELSDDGAP